MDLVPSGYCGAGIAFPVRIGASGPETPYRRRYSIRGQHVTLFAVHVMEQRDARGPVRVVLDGGNFGRDSGLVPLEINDPGRTAYARPRDAAW
jgi:hypothetical protein